MVYGPPPATAGGNGTPFEELLAMLLRASLFLEVSVSFLWDKGDILLVVALVCVGGYLFARGVLGFGSLKKTSAFQPTEDALSLVAPASERQPHRCVYVCACVCGCAVLPCT
jgi:hypothetical protein